MAAFIGLFRHDLRLALRQGGETGLVLGFFVLAVVLFPLGVGPEPAVLQRIGAGIVWVAKATRPPAARCTAMACSRRTRLSSSSALKGSSRSQRGAGITNSRVSARRRRWPADNQRHGQSATGLRAKAASAAASIGASGRNSRPRSAAQKTKVSRGVSPGLTAS